MASKGLIMQSKLWQTLTGYHYRVLGTSRCLPRVIRQNLLLHWQEYGCTCTYHKRVCSFFTFWFGSSMSNSKWNRGWSELIYTVLMISTNIQDLSLLHIVIVLSAISMHIPFDKFQKPNVTHQCLLEMRAWIQSTEQHMWYSWFCDVCYSQKLWLRS